MNILQGVLFTLFIVFLVRLLRPNRSAPHVWTPLGESHASASHAALTGGAYLAGSASENPPDCGPGVGDCAGGGADFGGVGGDCGGGGGGGDFGGGGW